MVKKKSKRILGKIFTTDQRILGKWQIAIGILALFFSFNVGFFNNRFSFSMNYFYLIFSFYALITGYYNLKVSNDKKK